jgi:membrane protease YdiL (CAAX protease family)
MKRGAWREAIGMVAPRGVMREIGLGIVGYITALPLFVAGVLAVVLLHSIVTFFSGEEPAAPSNPIVELLSSSNVWMIVAFGLTAVVWAPLCEELVFRGALLRHFSGRVPMVAGCLLSALLFAFMHNYGPIMTPPLVMLGFAFALMRWWRGSLIASMTAHALHNGSLLLLVLVLLEAMGT